MSSVSDELICSICLDVADEAVESSCCHHMFCRTCTTGLTNSKCPLCKQLTSFQPSPFARRMISRLPQDCTHCGKEFTREGLKNHQTMCGVMECKVEQCKFKCEKMKYPAHLAQVHAEFVVKNLDGLFGGGFKNNSTRTHFDPKVPVVNAAGAAARLGVNAKYYCQSPVVPKCKCCNGFCGPYNGCNCIHCMKLDLEARQLPKGFLVNREGAPARKDARGNYYCGREIDFRLKNFCGVNDFRCFACENLSITDRYDSLL